MQDSNLDITIAIPLKKWESCTNKYKVLLDFCQYRRNELRDKATSVCCHNRTQNELHLVPEADMYDFCIAVLSIAQNHSADIKSIETKKKETAFTFGMKNQKDYQSFYNKLVRCMKEHNIVDSSETEI